mmetsp:Transcript_27077/g.43489  ORF Transcript_27077/g.43489 Transcript_27077/m.43489 type:complete len:98 (-) Transcript_27077:1644-1937(-)
MPCGGAPCARHQSVFQFFRPAAAAGRFSRIFVDFSAHYTFFPTIFFRNVGLQKPQVVQNATCDGFGVVAGVVAGGGFDLRLPLVQKLKNWHFSLVRS